MLQTQCPQWLTIFVLCATLCACGGKNGTTVPLVQTHPTNTTATPTADVANATFVFEIPHAASQQTQTGLRRPQYISSATLSLSITLTTVNGSTPSPLPTAQVVNVTSTTNGCGADPNNVGNVLCTITTRLPVGTDMLTISSYDASNAAGHLLSQQIFAAVVVAAAANSYSFTLDANPNNASIIVTSTGSATGSQGAGFIMAPTGGAQTFAVTLKDAAGATVLGPGQPGLSAASGSTGISTVAMSSGTLTATPVSGGVSSITLTLTPANSQSTNDGLSSGNTSFNLMVQNRAMWVWTTPNNATLISFAQAHGISDIFFAVSPNVNQAGTENSNVAALHTLALAAGIRLDALGGDPTWADNASGTASAITWENNAMGTGFFVGAHFDIEPSPALGSAGCNVTEANSFISALNAIHQNSISNGWNMNADVQFGDRLCTGVTGFTTLTAGIVANSDQIVILSYRKVASGGNGIWDICQPSLAIAFAAGKPAQCAAQADNVAPASITFFGQTATAMGIVLTQVDALALQSSSLSSYRGIAIEAYASYSALAP